MRLIIKKDYDFNRLKSDIDRIIKELQQIYNIKDEVLSIGDIVLDFSIYEDGKRLRDAEHWKLGQGYKMLDELLEEFKNKKGE